MNGRELQHRLKALPGWIAEMPLVWPIIGGIVTACLLGYIVGYIIEAEPEGMIRIAGLALQFGGLGIVALGLHKTRKQFGRQGVLDRLREQLRRFPLTSSQVPRLQVSWVEVEVPVAQPKIYKMVTIEPEASAEERIAALEANLQSVREQVTDTQKQLNDEVRKLREVDKQERRDREQTDQGIQRQLEDFSVSGLDLELVGLVWLGVGILFATVPGELARLLPSWMLTLIVA